MFCLWFAASQQETPGANKYQEALEVLGFTDNAPRDAEEVGRAFRQRAKTVHPDKIVGHSDSFLKVHEAKEFLIRALRGDLWVPLVGISIDV